MSDALVIANERRFAVSAEAVFDAFSDPLKLVFWWGPHGFSNHITKFDFREGGAWHITMTASDGNDFANQWTFLEIEENRLIRARHHLPVHDFILDMRFDPDGAGSRLQWRMYFEPTEENQFLARFLAAANDQNLERLADFLDKRATDIH